jgi:hypothetical protein
LVVVECAAGADEQARVVDDAGKKTTWDVGKIGVQGVGLEHVGVMHDEVK